MREKPWRLIVSVLLVGAEGSVDTSGWRRCPSEQTRIGKKSSGGDSALCNRRPFAFVVFDGAGRAFDPGRTAWHHKSAGWSSPVARWAHNPKVAGSNPAPATKRYLMKSSGLGRVS